ncbi:hypothetical protein LCGC14_0712260 [marine sediment metagenome]|uniref:Uncharacterized protein n=1 Tax=marine sediment metagenome TaxID=412755 RepID=A0A0F9QEQ6_9ZZZZ
MATLYRVLLALNGIKGPAYYQAGDSTLQPGYVATRDDSDEVKVATASDAIPLGVCGATSYMDLNTAVTAGRRIPIWLCGSGVEVMVLHDDDTGAATLIRGQKYIPDDANAGAVMLWAYTDAAVATDTMSGFVGRLTEDVTISGDTPTFIPLLLSL